MVRPKVVDAAGPGAAKCQTGFLQQAQPTTADCPTAAEPSVVEPAAVITGFQESVVWSGFTNPTVLRFAADGRVFVAEKSGVIKVFDNLGDPTPTVFSNTSLLTNVHDFWDRGVLGMALDPSLTGGTGTGSFVYLLYAYDHILGGSAPPRWGDTCPNPPGATTDGCLISGRISRFAVSGTSITGPEQVLVEDWCQQFPTHSIGTLTFGPDEALYASGGDGSSFNNVDYGQFGGTSTPIVVAKNPCGDPFNEGVTPPIREGGSLRTQDLRTAISGQGGDPVSLDGAILRVDPATGAGLPGNPFFSSTDPNARRIIAYGLRNPFRVTFRPGTNELWVGDVGWLDWEEINKIPNATDGVFENFGWPCYEGNGRQGGYDATNLTICENLYSSPAGTVASPVYTYNHSANVVSTDNCPTGSSSITGLAFYPTAGGAYPASYDGGVFFADHSRNCIWFIPTGGNGEPDPNLRQLFVQGAANPVDLVIGPGNDLFYVDFNGGTIRRISATGGNQPPTAVIQAVPTSGPAPLTVQFDGSDSFDPEGTPLAYAWDLDNDGFFDDGNAVTASRTYNSQGNVTVRLRVTDAGLATGTDSEVISVGNSPPLPVISTPAAGTTWNVGKLINFSGSATDPQDGALPASALTWTLVLQHCPSNCHPHALQTFHGVASGSFNAPDHDYPSYLELTLTATDSFGTQASVTRRIDPQTVVLTFRSVPTGLSLAVNATSSTTQFQRTVIVGSQNSVTATSPLTVGGTTYTFASWSDSGGQSHTITGPATNTTYTANYTSNRISFFPSADANIRSNRPNKNFGSRQLLRVRLNMSRVYVKFNVTGLSGAPSSAKLRLWVTDGGPNGGSVYSISNTTWTNAGITWNNAPAITGTPLSSLGAVTTGKFVEFNLGSVITGNGKYTFAISKGRDDAVGYASRETTHDPVLLITP